MKALEKTESSGLPHGARIADTEACIEVIRRAQNFDVGQTGDDSGGLWI